MNTKAQCGVSVQDCRALGLVFGQSVNAGLVQQHEVEINPEAAGNVLVSVKATPFSLTVKNFEVNPTNRLHMNPDNAAKNRNHE